MYAIVDIAGQQHKVATDEKITALRIDGEVGSDIEFDSVLLVNDDETTKIGQPYVEGAKVTATIIDQFKGDKVLIFKKKRRKTYRVLNGFRQSQTKLQIKDIAF